MNIQEEAAEAIAQIRSYFPRYSPGFKARMIENLEAIGKGDREGIERIKKMYHLVGERDRGRLMMCVEKIEASLPAPPKPEAKKAKPAPKATAKAK